MTEDVCHHIWGLEGVFSTLDGKERLNLFAFLCSMEYNIGRVSVLSKKERGAVAGTEQ